MSILLRRVCLNMATNMKNQNQTKEAKLILKHTARLYSSVELEPNRDNVLDIYPAFAKQLQEHFPGAVPVKQYFAESAAVLAKNHNFAHENTMGLFNCCRDEIVGPFFAECVQHWGQTFNCCSIAGFVTFGKTGLTAASEHVPTDLNDKLRRFVFYAMPHVAISADGEIGLVYREGVSDATDACAALVQIAKELDAGELNLTNDADDVEHSIVRQKVLSELYFAEVHTRSLSDITKIACKLITRDAAKLLDTHLPNPSEFEYAVQTGIQIHGPHGSDWVWPFDNYLVSPRNNFTKHRLNSKTMTYEL